MRTPKGYFDVKVKPKHWWSRKSRKQAKAMEALAVYLVDEQKVLDETNRRLTNIMLYGTEEKSE